MRFGECSAMLTIHLIYLAKSCGAASLGIRHQPDMANNICKNDVCTQILSFVCEVQFQNIFGTSYNKEVAVCQTQHNC
jgi:hypothetical protein